MLRYIDRSRIERDWTCPRSRYWSTEYEGRGIAPVSGAVELEFGKAVAGALEEFFTGDSYLANIYFDLNTDLNQLPVGSETQRREYLALGEGLVRGYLERIWPRWERQYKVIGVEVECSLPIPGTDTEIMVRPDLVVEDKETGAVYYVEHKTSSAKTEQFITHWSGQAQMHLGVAALERKLGRPVAGVIVQGMLKGYIQRDTRYSPFANVYVRDGDIRYEYTRGYDRRGVWNIEGGVERIVRDMPPEVLNKQFPCTPPIVVRGDIVESLLKQQMWRETDITFAHSNGVELCPNLDKVYPQHLTSCDPMIGHPCPFKAACFNPSVRRDPVRSGLYGWREPHHEPERKQFEERGLL